MWLSSYLTNRKQYIELNYEKTSLKNLNCGIPQGSILGPMLFLIYINDIEKSTSLKILSYADDTTVYQSGPNVDNLIINTNHELKLLYDWLCANK